MSQPRAVPVLERALNAVLTTVQRRYLVEGMRGFMGSIWPEELALLVALRIPILDCLNRQQLVDAIVHLRKYRSLIVRLSPEEMEVVVQQARSDLYFLIARNGGREWLKEQLEDIKDLAQR